MAKNRVFRWAVRVILALTVLMVILLPVVTQAEAGVIPTIGIVSVNTDVNVKIRTYNFPANRTFTARMGEFGTKGVGGEVVGVFDSGAGGSFEVTFNIPVSLQGRKLIAIRTDSQTGGYYSYNWFTNKADGTSAGGTGGTAYSGIPTFSINSVTTDTSVTILTNNFPPNKTFTTRMGLFGTKGIGGVVVGTFTSGTGGSFQQTFTIPNELKGLRQIAIRTDADSSGYYSYNWFWNDTSTPVVTPEPGYTGIPTFSISTVVTDATVTILTNNFPPGKTFTVRVGEIGTRGIGGIVVGTFSSGTGGALTQTFTIPDALKGREKIAIRTDSDSGGYYSYNWFVNKAGGTGSGGGLSGYSGYPTFSITSVVKDGSVTILTHNLPPGQSFTVRMGAYGTKAIGGVVVATTDSGTGGAQSLTYTIPDSLKGSSRIAIRMDCSLGYYAYNWFYNNNAP